MQAHAYNTNTHMYSLARAHVHAFMSQHKCIYKCAHIGLHTHTEYRLGGLIQKRMYRLWKKFNVEPLGF